MDRTSTAFSSLFDNFVGRFLKLPTPCVLSPTRCAPKDAMAWAEADHSSNTSESTLTEDSSCETLSSDTSDLSDNEENKKVRIFLPIWKTRERHVRFKSTKRVRFSVPSEPSSRISLTSPSRSAREVNDSEPLADEHPVSMYIVPFTVHEDYFGVPAHHAQPAEDSGISDDDRSGTGMDTFVLNENHFACPVAADETVTLPLSKFDVYDNFFDYNRDYRASCYSDYLNYQFPHDEVLCTMVKKRDRCGFEDSEWEVIWRSGREWRPLRSETPKPFKPLRWGLCDCGAAR